jgi:hypothetical protein
MRGKYNRTLVDELTGAVAAGKSVEIRHQLTGATAVLYTTLDGMTTIANPLTSDIHGFISFFADVDFYLVTVKDSPGGATIAEYTYETVTNPYITSGNWGTLAVSAGSFNIIDESGFYVGNTSTTGIPISDNDLALLHLKTSTGPSGNSQQLVITESGDIYHRTFSAPETPSSDWIKIAERLRQNNLSATTNPTVNDDASEGYTALSLWVNTSTSEIWQCITNTEGAAVWEVGTLTVDDLGNVALLNANTVGQNLIQLTNPSAITFLRINADNTVTALSASSFRTAIDLGTAALLNQNTVGGNLVQLANPSAITFLRINADNTVTARSASDFRTDIGAGVGSVTSVTMTVPTGLSISGSPITSSGTLAVTLTAGYAIPTTAKQTEWDTAYTDRNKWDGGATGLVAATGRTSLELVKVTSNTDGTTGSVMTVGYASVGLNAGNVPASLSPTTLADMVSSISGFYRNTSTTTLNGLINAGSASAMPSAVVISKIQYDGSNSVYPWIAAGGSARAGFLSIYSSASQLRNVEFWTNENLVKVTGATDTTSGSVLTVGYQGFGGIAGLLVDYNTAASSGMQTSFFRIDAGTSNRPVAVTASGLHVRRASGGGESRLLMQESDTANAGHLYYSYRSTGSWQTTEVYTTHNLSANVNTMLGSADNAAIRSNIGANSASNINAGTLADTYLPSSMTGKTFSSDVSIGANLIFTGSSRKITADLSNATIANRTLIQSSTTNGETNVGAIPNGSSTTAGFTAYANATPTNTSTATMRVTSTAMELVSGVTGSGTNRKMDFVVAGATRVSINTSTGLLEALAGLYPGNAVAAQATTFDWYERGVFTPVVEGSSTAGTATYSVQVGRFQRSGNRVSGDINLSWTGHTGTGTTRIAGLPFTSANVTNAVRAISLYSDGMPFTSGNTLQGMVQANVTYININERTPAGAAANHNVDAAVTSLRIFFDYEV